MPSTTGNPEIPGQTAPRVIANIKQADRRFRDPLERNPFTDPPRGYNETLDENRKNQRVGSCKHFWTTKTDQSVLPRQERGLKDAKYRLACFCQLCRWHVDITIQLFESSCPFEGAPLHHFAKFAKLDGHQEWYEGKCSICAAKLNIEYREPRLTTEDTALLTDTARLQQRLQLAWEKDPDRPDLKVTQPVMVLDALATYIRDSLQPKETHREIPRLNRRFLLSFGEDCEPLLRKLHFVQTEQTWQLPQPPPEDPWSADLRQRLQDVQEELWALMRRTMDTGQQGKLKAYHEKPPPSDNDIKLLLSTIEYDKTHFVRRATFIPVDEELLHAGLGTLGDFTDELLIYAFEQQVKHDLAGTPYYYDCLAKLADKRKSETLETKVMTLASEGYFGREEVNKAYKYFSLDAWNAANYTDEYIRNTFEARLGSVQSWQETEMRQMLRVIALSRGSKSLEGCAANEKFRTASEAFKWLFDGVDSAEAAADDVIQALAAEKLEAAKVNGTVSDMDREKVMEAMTLIADDRNSNVLRNWIAARKDGDNIATFEDDDLTRAFNYYNIQDRSGFVDMDVLQTMLTMKLQDPDASSMDKENSLKYFEIIKNSDSSRTATQDVAPIDHNSPVGLQNLGNTCYLNSLLQYFYAIKRFREIVTNLDRYKLPLEHYPDRAHFGEVGGLKVSRAYARWAQHDFLPQLATLFNGMYTSPGAAQPDVKLARDFLVKLEHLDLPADNSFSTPSTEPANAEDTLPSLITPPSSIDSDGSASDTSDTTLVGDVVLTPESDADENKDSDIPMVDAAENDKSTKMPDDEKKNIDPHNENLRTEQLKRAAEQVAQQQDVHEIANNLISKAVCAMKPSGTDWNGRERDEITKLFYSSFHENKRNSKEPAKVVVDNTVFVHLHDRPAGIPEGLEAACELDHVTEQYRTYVQPAPILQICFQNQEVVAGERKIITHPFHVPLELNLTRYMDKPCGELLALRKQYWDLHRRIQDREEANAQLHTTLKDTAGKTAEIAGFELLGASSHFLKSIREEFGAEIDEMDSLTSTLDTLSEECGSVVQQRNKEISAIDVELKKTSAELNDRTRMIELTSESEVMNFEYTLFAVFVHCSRDGNPGHGHYYIYIRDFAGDKWRCYNDDHVTIEDGDINKWIHGKREGDTGRPNLVVYVKTSDKEKLTQPLYRKEHDPAENTSPSANGVTSAGTEKDMHDSGAEDDTPPKVHDETSATEGLNGLAEGIALQAKILEACNANKSKHDRQSSWNLALTQDQAVEADEQAADASIQECLVRKDQEDSDRQLAQALHAGYDLKNAAEWGARKSQSSACDGARPDPDPAFIMPDNEPAYGQDSSAGTGLFSEYRMAAGLEEPPKLAGEAAEREAQEKISSCNDKALSPSTPECINTGKECVRAQVSGSESRSTGRMGQLELKEIRKLAARKIARSFEAERALKLGTGMDFGSMPEQQPDRKQKAEADKSSSENQRAALLQAEQRAKDLAKAMSGKVEADKEGKCRAAQVAETSTVTFHSPAASDAVASVTDGVNDENDRGRSLESEIRVVEMEIDIDFENDDKKSELSGFSSNEGDDESADESGDGSAEEGSDGSVGESGNCSAAKCGDGASDESDEGKEKFEDAPEETTETGEHDEGDEDPEDSAVEQPIKSSPDPAGASATLQSPPRAATASPTGPAPKRRRVTFAELPKRSSTEEPSDGSAGQNARERGEWGLSHVYPFH
ncbi:hypothetical protein FKW77_000266 [Venturia effusa]|uniref:ubiquitinyl hydrolase 1 n=1 Tax=Venturia effusa TaxID=50376 RepID=A0A517LQF3_9PEZI|nr:hypothetical protein FKW77_000266 [Venturia effusa]